MKVYMKIELVRSDSKGIDGTLANAKHHAPACLPLVTALVSLIPMMGFKIWKQGHNVHVFITKDDRKFDIVPYLGDNGEGVIDYIGLELRFRQSRSIAIPILHIEKLYQVCDFANTMKLIAKSHVPNNRTSLQSKAQ